MKNNRKIGENQMECLKCLLEHRGWSPACGWVWSTYSGTVRILDSLVKRGLASVSETVTIHKQKVTQYKITEAGKQEVFANSAWHKLKYGEQSNGVL